MQIAAVASAIGLTGTAIANDTDRTPSTDTSAATMDNGAAIHANTPGDNGSPNNATTGGNESYGTSDLNGNASSSTTSDLNGNGSSSTTSDLNGNAATPNGDSTSGTTGQVERGATQGSTMTSPQSTTSSDANAPSGGALYGSGSSATSVSGQDRLGNTDSDNFDARMSDYAAQHNGRISRDEFMSEMGNRWDQLDTRHNGLTPYEVQEIFVFTPPENAAPARSGSDVQSGDMGPSNARGQ
ncbi:MAG TPA: hypothetical protein VN858_00285 [Casimicrobiaceae bacterium]|nr:hypothetical protein [Casimicrobiaceae bacterium]